MCHTHAIRPRAPGRIRAEPVPRVNLFRRKLRPADMSEPAHDAHAAASPYHAPVLVGEVVALLADAAHVLDGTLGGGGHALALLEAGVGRVTAIDRDPEAVAEALDRLAPYVRACRFRALL